MDARLPQLGGERVSRWVGGETVMRLLFSSLLRCAFGFAIASAASAASAPPPDEAQFVGRPAASFPQASEDYFHDMDNGAP